MEAKIKIGRTALELVAEKGVHHHVAVVDASNGTVPVHLHDQPRWAAEVVGPACVHATGLCVDVGNASIIGRLVSERCADGPRPRPLLCLCSTQLDGLP
jgi:hypothetical protein